MIKFERTYVENICFSILVNETYLLRVSTISNGGWGVNIFLVYDVCWV
jgi:hypothetical protein